VRVSFAVIGSLLVLGCGRAEPEPAPAPTSGAETPSRTTPARGESADIRDYMASHFVIALFAHDRLVEGDLAAIREPLTEFAAYRYDDVAPGSWLPWLARIQEAARIASQAREIEPAATAIAAIARDCGGCHEAHGKGPARPQAVSQPAEPKSETVPDRMRRHAWAIDEMWEGLVFPSDAAWQAGADAMASGTADFAPGESSDETFAALLAELRTLGAQAREASSAAARAESYAALLTRCAACHARAEVTRYE
jgi:cytochrome c553